jgi:hypothetical protein
MTRYAPLAPRHIWTIPKGKIAIHNRVEHHVGQKSGENGFRCGSTIPITIMSNARAAGVPTSDPIIRSALITSHENDSVIDAAAAIISRFHQCSSRNSPSDSYSRCPAARRIAIITDAFCHDFAGRGRSFLRGDLSMPTIALVDDDRNILTSVSMALEALKTPMPIWGTRSRPMVTQRLVSDLARMYPPEPRASWHGCSGRSASHKISVQ